MKRVCAPIAALFALIACQGQPVATSAADTWSADKITVNFLGNASLRIDWADTVIHVDPVRAYADYDAQPKADIILVTHEHGDHLDAATIATLTKPNTALIVTQKVFDN